MRLSPLLTGIPLALLPALPAAAATASVSPPPGPDAPAPDPPSSFSLAAAKQPGRQGNFVRDWVAARQKWGGAIPDLTAEAFSLLDDDGRVDVEPLGMDDIYIADVEIGEPPQLLKIAIDTGSSDLWVQSTDTVYLYNHEGPWAPQYDPSKSSTAERIADATWRVRYMDGNAAEGIAYRDTLTLGPFRAPNATVQSARRVAPRFEREPRLTGMLGLAKTLPSTVRPPQAAFLPGHLAPLLGRPVFTADLRRDGTGRFDFGVVDDGRTRDGVTWVPTDGASHHWDVAFDLVSWGTNTSSTPSDSTSTTPSGGGEGGGVGGNGDTWWRHPFTATVDTGTTLMFLPDVLSGMYWYDVPGMRVDPRLADAYTFPCALAKNLPDLRLKLPGTEHVLVVPGAYLNYGPTDQDGEGYCWGGMQSAAGMNVTILGDVMLKALFVAFDMESQMVGFANKNKEDL